MKIIQTDNRYSIYAGEATLIAEATLPKFWQALGYETTKKGARPKLHLVLETGFQGFGEELNWESLKDGMLNPTKTLAEMDFNALEELPPAPSWEEILKDIAPFRHYVFEVLMTVCASNKFIENPPWLGVIAPPSTGKTFLMKLFDHPAVSLMVDDFTDNALAAGKPNKDAADVSSMLDDADGKNLIMNDMSSIFTQREDKVNKFIGGLTTAYGGTFVKYSPGSGANRHNSHCSVMMGMTIQTYKTHRKYMSKLGNRFLFLTFKRPPTIRHRQDNRKFDANELRLKVCAFQQQIINKPNPILSNDVDDYLFDFVHKVVIARGLMWTGGWDELEGESRLYQEMIELCFTRAKIRNDGWVKKEDIDFFKELCYETIPNVPNLKRIHAGVEMTNNSKWVKKMLKNALSLGVAEEYSRREVKYSAGAIGMRTRTQIIYSWTDEYTEFFTDCFKRILYENSSIADEDVEIFDNDEDE